MSCCTTQLFVPRIWERIEHLPLVGQAVTPQLLDGAPRFEAGRHPGLDLGSMLRSPWMPDQVRHDKILSPA
jgi:hypothetical protein